jgi:hypothetical protein
VAVFERMAGSVSLAPPDGAPEVPLLPAALGRPLAAGAALATAPGEARLALRMTGGASLRLAAGSRARLVSATLVELDRGAVYVDTGAGPRAGEEVAVRTPAGLFQGLGTQFEVRAGAEEGTRLRVREGRVRLDHGGGSVLAEAGEELTVAGDGRVVRARVAAADPGWGWVVAAAPALDIEGVRVRVFLDWVARETGLALAFADAEAAALADATVLHGSIAHLTPEEAPAVVLASCGLAHRVAAGTLVVSRT